MAIVIKGMEMPETCEKCALNNDVCGACALVDIPSEIDIREERHKDCPLVEIPDALVEKYQELMKKHPDTKQFALLPFQKGEDK